MSERRILILGGTGEAISLATALIGSRAGRVITSLAGRTKNPELPPGEVRLGGFGGSDGLIRYVQAEGIDLLINATHPFAAEMSRNALSAHQATRVPLLRLLRLPWEHQPGDRWILVENASEAARECRQRSGAILLTLGVKDLACFRDVDASRLIVRVIEMPNPELLPGSTYVVARGPFSLEAELELMRQHQIGHLVAKQSGGEATRAKIDAARILQIPVIMIERPPIAREPGCPVFANVKSLLDWISRSGLSSTASKLTKKTK